MPSLIETTPVFIEALAALAKCSAADAEEHFTALAADTSEYAVGAFIEQYGPAPEPAPEPAAPAEPAPEQ